MLIRRQSQICRSRRSIQNKPGAQAAARLRQASVFAVECMEGRVLLAAHIVGDPTVYATIQSAVNAAAPGATINVDAGTYNEQVTITKSLTLLGANAGIHPAVGANTSSTVGTRGAETILSHNGLYAIGPQATNITIDGFEFTGTGSREIDAETGNISNLHLTNNIFADTATSANAGIVNLSAPTATGVMVDYNSFVNRGGGYSFYAGGNGDFDGLRIANNYLNGGAESVFWAAATPIGAVISNNEFDGTIGGVSGAGDPLLNIGSGGNIHIDDNYFHDMNYTAFQVGIVGGEVVGNTFSQMSPLTGGPFGDAFQLWGGEYGTSVSTNVNISDNIIHFNDNATYPTRGVRLRAQDSGSMAPGIDGTTIHINDNDFINDGVMAAGNGANAITFQGDQTKPVDASGNYWSTTNAANIAGLMVGTVDFTPYLTSGTDTSAATGFQGDYSTLDVTSLGSQTTDTGRIQEAVNLLADGALTGAARTINVGAGTYSGSLVQVGEPMTLLGAQANVDARKRYAVSESIVSNGEGDFQVLADNVTINGFTLEGVITSSSVDNGALGSAIWMNPSFLDTHGGTQILDNIIQGNIIGVELDNDGTYQTKVQYNLFQNNDQPGPGGGNAIETSFGLTNALIDNNTFTNNPNSALAVEAPSQGIVFSNNTADSAVALFSTASSQFTADTFTNSTNGAFYLGGGDSDITIQDSTVTGVSTGQAAVDIENPYFTAYSVPPNGDITVTNNILDVHGGGGAAVMVNDRGMTDSADSGTVTVFDNSIKTSGSDVAIDNESTTTVDASGNWWGTTNATTIAGLITGSGPVDFTPYLNSGANSASVGFQGDFSTLDVTTLGTQTSSTGRIQEAINLLANGALTGSARTVNVGAGTFSADVSVNEALTLNGAQAGIAAPGRSGSESIIQSPDGTTELRISANDATVNGFTIQGNTNANNVGAGIYIVPGTSGTHILNNIVQNNIIGLDIANASATDQVQVIGNLFQNNTNPGASSGTDIYADQYTAGNGGVQDALIQNNTFTNTSFVEDSWGIGFSNTHAATFNNIQILGDTFSNSGRGMYFYGTTNLTVSQSTVTGATHYAIGLFGADYYGDEVNNAAVTISSSTLTGNGIGIAVEDGGDTTSPALAGGALNIANDLINGNTTGILVTSNAIASGATVTVVDSSLAGNSAAGLNNASAVTINAVKNWWGSAYGPSIAVASPPKGDVIIGPATYSQWRESGHNNEAPGAPGFLPDAFTTGAAVSFSLATPNAAAAFNAFTFGIRALDTYGQVATGYTGMVHFTSTSAGLLPSNATLTNSVGVFSAVLNNLGNQTITASDSMTPAITGTSANIFVYRGSFDFGTATSPVATNYVGVNPATTYSMAQGYGWQSGTVMSFDTGYTTNSLGLDPNIARDFNYTFAGAFAANVPNGLYDVTLTLGDDRGFAYPQTVSFGGTLVDTLTTGGSNPAAIAKTYVVGVLNGQLQIGIGAASGGTYGVIDGVTILPDTTAFAVSSSTPATGSTAFGPINQMSIVYNHPIGANATTASNYTLTGPGGLTVTSVTANGTNGVTLNFSGSTVGGSYSLAIASGVQDAAGNLLGATPAITFTQATVTSGKYDFGTSTSPVAAGYTPVSPATTYVAALGYGWQPGANTITGFDTGVTAYTNPDVALTRDYDYTLGSTFSAAVGNGLYDVTVTLGDARGYGYTQNISFGGTLVDTVSTGSSNPAIVNKTYVVGVTNGQLNLGVAGVGGGFAVLDGLSFVQDASTFSVTATTPANGATIFGPVSQLTVTFDHPLGANATTTSNYSLSGPGGLSIVSATPVVGSNAITLNLSGSTGVGAYTLTVGANIQDAVNNTLGTATVVHFTQSQLTTGQFDFGTPTSPVAAGYTQITPASAFTVAQGFGWLSGANTIGSLDTGVTNYTLSDMSRDFNYTAGSTFAANVANGLYDVTLTLGDAHGYAYPQTVTFGGTLYDTLTTGGSNPAVITRNYVVGVTGGQLDVGLAAGAGGTFAVVDGLSFVPDTTAFTVSSSTPAAGSTSFGPVSQMSITFSHPVGAAVLNHTNYTLTGPGGLTITNVTQVNASTVNLTFSGSTTVGSYSLAIGAGVVDVAGNALTSSNTIAFSQGTLSAASYDFGTATSPVATGYTQITPSTVFTTGLGYGWLSGTIGALDTTIPSFTNPDPNVTRDFNYTASGTFAANVPNGLYDVTLVLGDARQYTYPQTISFGGVVTDNVTTTAITVKTYVVGVTTGQLDVGIAAGMGGTYGVIDGLSFTPDMTTFGIASSSPAANQTAYGNVSSATVTYNHPIGASALVAGNYTLNGTAGVGIASVVQTSPYSVTLNFTGQATSGVYSLGITANVKDAGGNAIAATSIPFTTALNNSAQYAFEPPASPNPIGYTAVTPGSLYNNVAGYGWATSNVAAFDTGVINTMSSDPNLYREFNYTTNDTFQVYLANGTYNVTLALGDARGYSYTMGINFQGGSGPQDSVTTGGINGAIVNKTYTVTVTNGTLSLLLTGATNSFAVISAMTIAPH